MNVGLLDLHWETKRNVSVASQTDGGAGEVGELLHRVETRGMVGGLVSPECSPELERWGRAQLSNIRCDSHFRLHKAVEVVDIGLTSCHATKNPIAKEAEG